MITSVINRTRLVNKILGNHVYRTRIPDSRGLNLISLSLHWCNCIDFLGFIPVLYHCEVNLKGIGMLLLLKEAIELAKVS